MLRFHRIGLVAALVALAVIADSNSALAQRRGSNNFGGNNNNNNNNNQDGKGRNRNRDKDEDKKSDVQQFQNLIQGGGQSGQGGQNNSGNSQQFRKSGNQQGGQQTFKNSQQFQQFIQGGQGGQGQKWQSQKFNKHNELQKWVVGFNGGPRPFSNDWYKNHPQAWHYHNNNDNWEIATAAGVFGWLGWQNARPYNNTVYVYDPVPVQTVIVNGQPTVVVDPGNPGDWMTLGSYSLMTGAGDPGTRILQLSVDKSGNIRGSYYDMITNATHNVIGVIDKNTQQARWTLDTNRQLTFVATLDQLTQSQGVVNVKLPGGQVQQWQLVRMENATN
jgi:hypothetical protein